MDAAGGDGGSIADVSPAQSLRSVQRLLWDVLSERLREAERDEVKRAVGFLLVEENEALFSEATALADILGDVQMNTSTIFRRRALCSNPERNMVEADILMAMDKLRSMVTVAMFATSAAKDRNPEEVLRSSVDNNGRAVYDYMQTSTAMQAAGAPGALMSSVALQRPGTASSRPATASTLSRPSTASSTGSGNTTSILDSQQLLACVQGKLSVFGIDDVKEAVQCALREERAALLNDIEYLTALVTDEADMQAKAAAPPPSVQDLKRYSKKLKSLVDSEQSRLQHEQVVSRMFNAAQGEPSKAGKLRRMVGAARTTPTPGAGNGAAAGPRPAPLLGSPVLVQKRGQAVAAQPGMSSVGGDVSLSVGGQDAAAPSSSAPGGTTGADATVVSASSQAGAAAGEDSPLNRSSSSRRQLIQALRASSTSLGAATSSSNNGAGGGSIGPPLAPLFPPSSPSVLLPPPVGLGQPPSTSRTQHLAVPPPPAASTSLTTPQLDSQGPHQSSSGAHPSTRGASPQQGSSGAGPVLLQPLPGRRASSAQPHGQSSSQQGDLGAPPEQHESASGASLPRQPALQTPPRPGSGPAGTGDAGLLPSPAGGATLATQAANPTLHPQHSASSLSPQHSTGAAAPRPRGGKLVPADLLEAQAETLKGGVSAILAKHGYRPASATGTRSSAGSTG